MEEMKREYRLFPIIGSSHRYQIGKVKFHVASYFMGKETIEERFAELMLEDLEEGKNPSKVEKMD